MAALLMCGLSVSPWLPPSALWQWKLQLVLTEQGAWFAGACLAAAIAAGVRRVRSLSSLFLAAVFLGAGFLFFRPWTQYLADRAVWSAVMDKVFGAAPLPALAASAPAPVTLSARRADGSALPVLFYPAASSGAPFVVAVHAGGWDGGDPAAFAWLHRRLARRGWAVAAPAYRLAPAHLWPAQREDVLLAAALVKSSAGALGVDASRWALLGRSAGGQIAASAAAAAEDPALKGLALFYAPTDLLFAYENGREDDVARSPVLLRRLTGGTPADKPEVYRDASPYLSSARFPAALLMHGPRDPVTWVMQSRRFAGKLAGARTPMVLIEPPWATHGFDHFPSGPGGQAAAWAVERFLAAAFSRGREGPGAPARGAIFSDGDFVE